jgi:CHASE2 domain-containing sensor protein
MRRFAARHRPGVRTLAIAPLLGAIVGLVVLLTGLLAPVEDASLDLRARLHAGGRPSDIVVVAIDSKTFDELKQQWPFKRSMHGRAIDLLRRAGAKTIVYDIQFSEPTKPAEDLALYDAVGRARGTVLAATEIDDHGHTNILGGDENLARAHARAGAANLSTDAGGVIRRYPRDIAGLPSLAVRAVQAATGNAPTRFDADGEAWIDYRGAPGTFRTVSFSDLYQGKVDPSVFRGKIVVVGASAPSLQDVHATPMSNDLMSGPEVQANAIWTALDGNPLGAAPTWLGIVLVLLGSLAAPAVAARARLLVAVAAALALAAAYVLVVYLGYGAGVILPFIAPLAALAVALVTTIVAGYALAKWERARVAQMNEVLEERVRERTAELRSTQLEVVHRLGQAAEARDGETGLHIQRIGHLARALGLAIGMSTADAEVLQQASAMHDVGKIGIPDRILLKPGRLEPAERELMQTHTTIGGSILSGSSSQLLQMAEEIALTHHERWNGSGYPRGLRGEQIPMSGRICAIVDVFDALMSQRTYKSAWSLDAALQELRAGRGEQFDPDLLDTFLEIAPRLVADLTDQGFVDYHLTGDQARAEEAART